MAYAGEGDFSDPSVYQRTIGDLVAPSRPGRVIDLVNAVSREMGTDVADWRIDRLVSMAATMEREAKERQQ